MQITNGLIFMENGTFQAGSLTTRGDRITSIDVSDSTGTGASAISGEPETELDASGCYVIPGLTDVHFHGCDGYDISDATGEAIERLAAFEITKGVTSICPATMTLPSETISQACKEAANFAKRQAQGGNGMETMSELVGLHLEGPFINAAKKGAQKEDYICAATPELIAEWQEHANGLIKLISLAPETPGAIDCIRKESKNFHFSIAHTQADYATAKAAIDAGADHVTHLYNAMPAFTHRSPGVIGAAADDPSCMAELICDGIHIDPAVVRLTFRLFGENRMILISDSMRACGKTDGTYTLGGQEVTVTGNRAVLSNGTIAGSVTCLYDCMVRAVSMGIPLAQAIKAATINPCRSIGIDDAYGSIRTGKKAHLLLVDRSDLSLRKVIKGETVLSAAGK